MNIGFKRNFGFIFLAVYLILVGIGAIAPTLLIPSIVYGVLALVAGIFILIGK